jgi:hypothetical protein
MQPRRLAGRQGIERWGSERSPIAAPGPIGSHNRDSGIADAAMPIEALVTGRTMQQTEIRRSMQVARPIGPVIWWRCRRAVLLPQIALVLGVLALVGGALLAVGQYSRHSAEVRIAETNRFLDQLRSGPVAAAWARVNAAWRTEGARQEALLAQLASLSGPERLRVRRDHRLFVLETIAEYRLQRDIEVVRQFAIRVATCVRAGSCDRDAMAAQVGSQLWAFHHQHRAYFEFEYSGMDLEPYLETIVPRRDPRRIDRGGHSGARLSAPLP